MPADDNINYGDYFKAAIDSVRGEGRYRVFQDIDAKSKSSSIMI